MKIRLICPGCKTNVPVVMEEAHEFKSTKSSLTDEFEEVDEKVIYSVHTNAQLCLECEEPLVAFGVIIYYPDRDWEKEELFKSQVFPDQSKPSILEYLRAPAHVRRDIREAESTLKLSPRASAALSRRALHTAIVDGAKCKGEKFSDDIRAAKEKGFLFGRMYELVNAVRNCGNYAVHASWSKDTLEMIETSEDEARLLLAVAKDFVIHFYKTLPDENRLLKRINANAKNKISNLHEEENSGG